MSERPIRIGIAGCGGIARAVHIPLLTKRTDVQVRAIADSHDDARSAALAMVPNARAFDSVDELIHDGDVDAVVVALPTGAHAAAARAVLGAGRDLYLEKPLASAVDDGVAVLEAWRASGRIGMIGFNGRYNPLHRRLRDLVRSGRAGEPVHARTVFTTAPRSIPEWKRRRSSGGGALLDLGTHHIDLLRYLFDREPVAVQATLRSRYTEDDTAALEMEMDGGLTVHGFFSLAAAEHDHVEVYGERARLAVSRFTSLDVGLVDNPGRGAGALARAARTAGMLRRLPDALRARRSPLREPGYALALNAFLDAIRTRRLTEGAPDLHDGFVCLAVIDAAERSSRAGRRETIEPMRAAMRGERA